MLAIEKINGMAVTKNGQGIKISCFCLAWLLALTCVFSSCATQIKRPDAVLHTPTSSGYIPCISNDDSIEISAAQAFVYDISAGGFTYLKGNDTIMYPASTTKLLTILYALTLLDPSEIVAPGDELDLVAKDASIAYIKQSHKLSVEMLIEGMLLPSGNDAAYALAATAGKKLLSLSNSATDDVSGTTAVGKFIEGMNDYAVSIGMCGSHFESPDGYYSDGHYSTLEDIAIVSKLAYENEIIRKYSGLHEDDVIYASGHTNHWTNTNLMLDKNSEYYCPYVNGLKTGSAGKGNYSLICSLEISGRAYIIGVFSAKGKNERFADMKTIIDRIIAVSA